MKRIEETAAAARIPAGIYWAIAAVSLLCALYFVSAFVYVAASRMGYPFALEWLEGGSYAQVHRLLTGQPLYARPDMEYVAMIYPPLYYFAAALVARFVGLGFLPLRLVSFASTLGALGAIFLIVKRQGGSSLPGLLGSGLFAAAYQLSGSWFDIARVDMLSVFLVLLATWLLRLRAQVWHPIAGMVFALACLTKQTHLITLACLLVYAALFERRKLLTFVAPCLAALAMVFFALNAIYDGWFGFFTLKLALGSGEYVTFDPALFGRTALEFWLYSILLALPVVAVVILTSVIIWLRTGNDRAGLFFYLAFGAGLVGTSWAVMQVGGYKNDLVPAYAAISVLFGIGLQRLLSGTQHRSLGAGALLASCIAQFVLLWYPTMPQIPTKQDLAAGDTLLEQIHIQPGEVYIPFHPELALMADKDPFASWSPMFQLEGNYGGGDIRATGRVKTEFARAMERRQFSMIILDQEPNWIWGDPERFYRRGDEPVFADKDAFWPVTGWQTRPEIVLWPKRD